MECNPFRSLCIDPGSKHFSLKNSEDGGAVIITSNGSRFGSV